MQKEVIWSVNCNNISDHEHGTLTNQGEMENESHLISSQSHPSYNIKQKTLLHTDKLLLTCIPKTIFTI